MSEIAIMGRIRGKRLLWVVYAIAMNAAVMRHDLVNLWFPWQSDFLNLYTGGALAGSAALYDPNAAFALQAPYTGGAGILAFNRLPFYAALLFWLRYLSIPTAFLVWQCMNLAAVVGFVLLWPRERRPDAICACAAATPLFFAFARGQDAAIVLFAVMLFYRLACASDNRAGMALALGLIKWNLLLPAPILLWRRWRAAWNAAVAAVALVALSTAVAGRNWFSTYFAATLPQGNDLVPYRMPNLHGLFYRAPAAEYAATAAILLAVTLLAPRLDFPHGFCVAMAAGVLVSHHAYVYDLVLLIPVILIVMHLENVPAVLPACLILLLSPVTVVLSQHAAIAWLTPMILLAALALLLRGAAGRHSIRKIEGGGLGRPGMQVAAGG